MRMSPKLRAATLIAALAATVAAVRWADSLTDLQEASAGAVVAPAARATRAPSVVQDSAAQVKGDAPHKWTEAGTRTEVETRDSVSVAADASRSTGTSSGTSSGASSTGGAPGELDLRKLQRPRSAGPTGDMFGPRDFRPAPPVAKHPIAQPVAIAQPAPPPPPMAPPLPFAYIGKLAEEGNTTVFLALGERNLAVKPGDVIDNMYRLEGVNDNAVMLTHLPTGMQQSLPIGAQQ